ncbi:MAG: DUF3536 domain-containing protein [Candidatus Muiribacteriota bacterium]
MKNLIIHGHFYQPPRENPWLQQIESQQGAEPYHDFNEKIAAECYSPNAYSKYLDGYGRILDIKNNYENLSFNFGPTLLSWIEKKLPMTYNKIIEGDKISCENNNGHGNAIAQVYNHIILPLARERDIYTQIKWGIKDFEYHFNRKPEGMWLSETAINIDTVHALIDCGIKFTVLSPFQAEKIKKLNSDKKWQDVSSGSISPGRAYRIFEYDKNGKKLKNRYLDVFFYDRVLSPAISFEHLLTDAGIFKHRIEEAAAGLEEKNPLVNIATDGETFGHHEPFANMCVTAVIKELKNTDINLTNYGNFLELNPPKEEVILKKGDYGTAWSCSHGVARWYKNCGCTTDSPEDWNQKWRTPLRDAFNYLQEELNKIYISYLKDVENPWEFRDKYVEVLCGSSSKEEFLKKVPSAVNKNKILILMEIQKYSMFMFTSCGWFFGDISRIEPVHNMKYAIRALDLLEYIEPGKKEELEKNVKLILKQAASNIKEFKNGAYIWENMAKKAAVGDNHFANHFAIKAAITENYNNCRLFNRHLSIEQGPDFRFEHNIKKMHARIKLYNPEIDLEKKLSVMTCINEEHDIKTYITEKETNIDNFLYDDEKTEIFGLCDLFYDEREVLIKALMKDKLASIKKMYEKNYYQNHSIIAVIAQTGLVLPDELQLPARITLQDKLYYLTKQYINDFKLDVYKEIKEIFEEIRKFNIKIDKKDISSLIEKKLLFLINEFEDNKNNYTVENIIKLVEFNIEFGLFLNNDHEKNVVYSILCELVDNKEELKKKNRLTELDFDKIQKVLRLGELLNINIDNFRDRLNPFK